MSATLINGSPAWKDEAGDEYQNLITTDRAVWWAAVGSRQGLLRGGDWSTVAGQMALEVSAFLGLVEERDASGNAGVTHRGYAVWTDDTETVTFGVASASDRKDALVFAFVDTSVGAAALGTEASTVGGQLVVVPGVSGTTAARTDTQISDAVGSGGWVRLADVLIESTDTEIDAANVDEADGVRLDRTVRAVIKKPGAGAALVSNLSMQDITFAAIDEAYPASFADPVNNRLVIPRDGLYRLEFRFSIDDDPSGVRRVAVLKNSTQVVVDERPAATFGADGMQFDAAGEVRCSAGDLITGQAAQNSGGSLNMPGDSSNLYNRLSARLITETTAG